MQSSSKIFKSWDIKEESGDFLLDSVASQEGKEEVPAYLEEEVNAIINKAKTQAEEIIKNSYHEGLQQGFDEGFASGNAEGRAKAEEMYMQALQVLADVEKYRKERLEELNSEIMNLAMTMTEKIISTQLTLDEQIFTSIASRALRELIEPKHVTLYVNSKDAEELNKQKEKLSKELIGDIDFRIINDDNLPIGSCYIETDKGSVDASVNTQFNELKKALENA